MTTKTSPTVIELANASTCETCRTGCECTGPDMGCGHIGCWGALEGEPCAEAQGIRAAREFDRAEERHAEYAHHRSHVTYASEMPFIYR